MPIACYRFDNIVTAATTKVSSDPNKVDTKQSTPTEAAVPEEIIRSYSFLRGDIQKRGKYPKKTRKMCVTK